MSFHADLKQRLDARLAIELSEPGLFPSWVPGVEVEDMDGVLCATLAERSLAVEIEPAIAELMSDPTRLAFTPARTWLPELLALFKLGLVYFRDDTTELADTVRFDAVFQLVFRRAKLSHYVVLHGGPIAVVDSFIGPHSFVAGAAVIARSTLHVHCYVGRTVMIGDSFLASYAKAQVGAEVTNSLIGAYAGLDGGTHPEQYPLSSDGSIPAGVIVGRHCWVGHHTALLAGARVGEGVIVGSGAIVAKEVADHTLLVGNPARALPVDIHVRSLSPEDAFAAGRRQGPAAAVLPIYGTPQAAFASPTRFEIDYAEHGFLRQLAAERLLDFQRGALTALFAELLPEVRVDIRYRVGTRVRFEIMFATPVRPMRRLARDATLELSAASPPAELSSHDGAVYNFLRRGTITYDDLSRAVNEPDTGLDLITTTALADIVCRLSELGLFECRLLRWTRLTGHREDGIFDGLRDPSGASALPPFQAMSDAR